MEHRDIIADQIEQMGKVLAYILHDFLRLSGDVPVTQAMEETDHRLQNELDLDPEKVIGLPEEQLMSYLSSRLKADSQLEQLADFLLQTGMTVAPHDQNEAMRRLQRALEISHTLELQTRTTSLDILAKKKKISEWLSESA